MALYTWHCVFTPPLNLYFPLRPDFTSKLVYGLAFGTPKFYIAPYDKIKHELVNLCCNCDVKLGLKYFLFVSYFFHVRPYTCNCLRGNLFCFTDLQKFSIFHTFGEIQWYILYPSRIKHKNHWNLFKKNRSQFHMFKTIIDSIRTIQ